jgi:hypothetical protein
MAQMAKRPGSNPKNEWAFFDVVYEDGTQRSNRRVPLALLDGPEKDEPARGYIIEQDRECHPGRRQAGEVSEGKVVGGVSVLAPTKTARHVRAVSFRVRCRTRTTRRGAGACPRGNPR